MKQEKLTISFPKKHIRLKEELLRMKNEEDVNISSYVLSCIKKEIGCLR